MSDARATPDPYRALATAAVDAGRVKAVVFDLGNVLLGLDNELYAGAWPAGIGADHEGFEAWVAGENLWYAFETGAISTDDFTARLGERLGLSPKQVLDYWNSLLLGFLPGVAEGLAVLRKRYPLYVLSNTNAAHIAWVRAHAAGQHMGDFEDGIFADIFYSYELGSVKPEARIYEQAQGKIGLPAQALLFVDDRLENVEAARALGWQAVLLPVGEDVFQVLEGLGV